MAANNGSVAAKELAGDTRVLRAAACDDGVQRISGFQRAASTRLPAKDSEVVQSTSTSHVVHKRSGAREKRESETIALFWDNGHADGRRRHRRRARADECLADGTARTHEDFVVGGESSSTLRTLESGSHVRLVRSRQLDVIPVSPGAPGEAGCSGGGPVDVAATEHVRVVRTTRTQLEYARREVETVSLSVLDRMTQEAVRRSARDALVAHAADPAVTQLLPLASAGSAAPRPSPHEPLARGRSETDAVVYRHRAHPPAHESLSPVRHAPGPAHHDSCVSAPGTPRGTHAPHTLRDALRHSRSAASLPYPPRATTVSPTAAEAPARASTSGVLPPALVIPDRSCASVLSARSVPSSPGDDTPGAARRTVSIKDDTERRVQRLVQMTEKSAATPVVHIALDDASVFPRERYAFVTMYNGSPAQRTNYAGSFHQKTMHTLSCGGKKFVDVSAAINEWIALCHAQCARRLDTQADMLRSRSPSPHVPAHAPAPGFARKLSEDFRAAVFSEPLASTLAPQPPPAPLPQPVPLRREPARTIEQAYSVAHHLHSRIMQLQNTQPLSPQPLQRHVRADSAPLPAQLNDAKNDAWVVRFAVCPHASAAGSSSAFAFGCTPHICIDPEIYALAISASSFAQNGPYRLLFGHAVHIEGYVPQAARFCVRDTAFVSIIHESTGATSDLYVFGTRTPRCVAVHADPADPHPLAQQFVGVHTTFMLAPKKTIEMAVRARRDMLLNTKRAAGDAGKSWLSRAASRLGAWIGSKKEVELTLFDGKQ